MSVSVKTFDIETHSASDRFRTNTPDFFRVGGVGVGEDYSYTTDHRSMVDALSNADVIVGHNVINFDIPALGMDPIELTSNRKVLDTMIVDSLLDPPDFSMPPERAARDKYALAPACRRHGIDGKTADLRALARAHGGFGSVPLRGEFLDYLRGDVLATDALLRELAPNPQDVTDYMWREHQVAALAAHMSTQGMLIDSELLDERFEDGEQRRRELVEWLVSQHGIPTTLPNGKPAKSPHATKEGKRALVAAFQSVGVRERDLPHTDKGAVSFSADGLTQLAERHPAARELCEAVGALVGVRSVYGTAKRFLHDDGRVHPDVTMFQASGRWSITKPGLTVFGKRGGRVIERDIFVADPGFVLVSADLSQVDARSVAAHSGDPAYAKLFLPGVDAHIEIARMVWGRAVVDSDAKGYRDQVKAITHGSTYGMGVSKLAASAGVPEEEAQRVVDTLREEFPGVEVWKREVRERAEAGEMLDNGFGRLMRPNPERAFTQGPALMGQGTARDILMEGLLRMPPDVQRMLRAVVHDEVVMQCRREDAEEVRREIVKALTFEWCPPWMSDPVTFEADCSKPAERWSGCY